jgi:hypothetical protein
MLVFIVFSKLSVPDRSEIRKDLVLHYVSTFLFIVTPHRSISDTFSPGSHCLLLPQETLA